MFLRDRLPSERDSTLLEETFGILTEDDIYLDCVLVMPADIADADIAGIRVWVPRYPLTKSSLITCARQEVQAFGQQNKLAHLVFDLRGTGESEGSFRNQDYEEDLKGILLWAEERFGQIKITFMGLPESEDSTVSLLPLRPGVVMETYRYAAAGIDPPRLIYMSRYGNFGTRDEKMCLALKAAGYEVYGMDPYRYLLHASAAAKLTSELVWQDLEMFMQFLDRMPLVLAQPVSAGLALLWATGNEKIRGVMGLGRFQSGLKPPHIFDQKQKAAFHLPELVGKIANRPVCLIGSANNDQDEAAVLYSFLKDPKRLERANAISADYLLSLLRWMESEAPH